jgi:apolipoprotein N-acyltransferase
VVAGCVAAALVYGAIRMAQIDAAAVRAEKLSVGIVQPNMEQHAKWKDFREGLRRLVAGTRELEERHRPRLIVWPETAYVRPLPLELRRLPEEVAGSIRTPLVLGSMARSRLGGGRREFNRVLLADERGEIRGTYDKVNLVAFSEAMPFDDRLPWLRDVFPAGGRLTPGDHVRPLVLDGWRISALVCYEDVLPHFVRRVVREASPHLLVNLTNDAWFGDTLQPWMHLALAKFRAVEHRRYLVRATNTGVSAVVDPVGHVVVHSGSFTRETLHAEVAMLEGWTPYETLGDWPGWLGLGVIAWLLLRGRDTRPSKAS